MHLSLIERFSAPAFFRISGFFHNIVAAQRQRLPKDNFMRVGLPLIRSSAAVLCGVALLSLAPLACAAEPVQLEQEAESPQVEVQPGQEPGQAKADEYVSAVDLLPESTAGVIRIPELPAFCDAWERTQIGLLFASEEMQPFLDDQRERARSYFDSLNRKIGLKPDDLYEIASGEVTLAWLSFTDDKRRPYALCVIADIRDRKVEADQAAEKIDADLKAGGAVRTDVKYGDETIRVYRTKPKPGQLKIVEIALTWNDDRFIAADRESVVQGVMDVAAGKSPAKAFSSRASYQQVLADSTAEIDSANEKQATVCWQWYAEPFAMGRILREVVEYDRRDDLDVIELLERQGFGVIEAVGGVGVVAGKRFDVLHCGVVLAPGKLTKAARMLQSKNSIRLPIPTWPTEDTGAFFRFNWELESAFWAAESLVNDALGEDLFRPMIEGIRDDPEGPQIDIARDFLPNLENEVILITDNTMPAGPESDRMLVALRIKNADVVAKVVQKAMEVEPDAIKLEVPEFDVWRVERGKNDSDDIDAQLAALGFDENIDEEDTSPLLNHWAIAVVEGQQDDDADYLMFSSHSELLVKLGKRVRVGETGDRLAATERTKTIVAAIDDLNQGNEVTYDSVVHPSIALRARYELLRKGQLKDSDSLIANLLRRIVENDEDGEPDPIQAGKLPPFETIKEFFTSAGAFWEKTDSGWTMTGFLMAE
ncbi:hypothetical protein TBK1r_69840 [Stieleria magnilauensis]|uniref:Membrane or secreted protein n=2 Tax=Stieleria magnilauensis TaxID=2527963 RepID=A0ABX5Y101_9BACT|nr:hypothetical protein TBK1r_69840 [Planctomycetes bacterium TBK1r]